MNLAQNQDEENSKINYAINAMIVRYISADPQPGLVECRFMDAWGDEWVFIDKTAIFSFDDIDATSDYPCPGTIGCKIIKHWIAADGQPLVTIDTILPWGIEATSGESRFDVLPSQLIKL